MSIEEVETPEGEHHEEDGLLRRLAWQSIVGVVVMVVTVGLLGFYLREPISHLAVLSIDTLGLIGVFLGVFASDSIGFPVPASTYLFAAVAAESPMIAILIVASIASILGGSIAYKAGPLVGRLPILRGLLERFRPRGERLFKRWGIWTVGIAAATPLPFPIVCWLAGIYRMPFGRFFTATLVRAPRFAAYYGAFTVGWASAGLL